METTIAFVLGMSVVVVITLLIVAVIGFFKAIKTEKGLNNIENELKVFIRRVETSPSLDQLSNELNHRLDSILLEKERDYERVYRHIDEQIKESKSTLNYNVEELQRKIREIEEHSNRRMDDMLSQLDSRLDKLETKLKNYVDNHATMMKVALETHKITLND
jgi:DNA anti-recombination protein RmuC